jgi:hypothetical protein
MMKGSSAVRGAMKQRVTFERNYSVQAAGATDLDGFGQKIEDWRELCTVSCWAWQGGSGGKHTSAGEARVATMDSPGMVVPLGTDVTEIDRVQKVLDRAGTQIMGIMGIDFVATRQTHIELRLRAVA